MDSILKMNTQKRMRELEDVIGATDFIAHRTRNLSDAGVKRGMAAKKRTETFGTCNR